MFGCLLSIEQVLEGPDVELSSSIVRFDIYPHTEPCANTCADRADPTRPDRPETHYEIPNIFANIPKKTNVYLPRERVNILYSSNNRKKLKVNDGSAPTHMGRRRCLPIVAPCT